jgi:hypothetical protein
MYLSVVIPAYNEEQRIAKTLRTMHGYLQGSPIPRRSSWWMRFPGRDGVNRRRLRRLAPSHLSAAEWPESR